MVDSATVTAADVARLAGVGRAAVSNWRRRYEDFPEPVAGTASSPLFSLADIEAWLRGQGKLLEEVPAEERVWQRLRASSDDLRLAETVGEVGAFLLFLERAPGEWAAFEAGNDEAVAEQLTSALPGKLDDLPGPPPGPFDAEFASLVCGVAELAAGWGAARTFDFLCERYLEAHSRWTATTPPEVADLMAALADPRDGVVLDPACGTGGLLLACLPYGPARLAAQERDEPGARIAAVRLLLRDVDVHVEPGDSLRDDAFPDLRADAVLCNPPFNERDWGYEELAGDPRWEFGLPPRGEPELAWVQHALARTQHGGRAVMLIPAVVASRRSGRRLRAELLRSGALRAVVALPAGAAPVSTAAPHLWLLRRPGRDDPLPSHLLMADVSSPGRSWREIRAIVEQSWRAYLEARDDSTREPGTTATIPLIELLDEEVDLTPARHLPQQATDAGADFAATREKLAATVAELSRTISGLEGLGSADREAEVPTMTTVGEQSRAGALAVHQSPLRQEGESGRLPLLTVQDVTLGRPPTGRAPDDPAQITLQSGDIVMPAVTRRVGARVISDDGGVLGPHLYLVRADPDRFDPDFLAGFLRIAGRASATRAQSGSSRIDVRKARFPRVPLAQQRRYGAAFRQLALLEHAVRHTSELGQETVRLGLDGLSDRSLRPAD